jgi:pyruvate dehydrogenase E2 component (dihydrolipoamide acetyltransferase)
MTDEFKAIPLTQMRRIIAARMVEASQTIPDFRLSADIEVDRLLELRQQLLAERPGVKLSLNDLLIKSCAMALMDEPAINIQWADTEIHQFGSADISVVTAVEGGLTTPIIRQANRKSAWEIAEEVRALVERAQARTLKRDEIVGGSFSISNLGMYGVDRFDAIINPPQCAILAVGAANQRPLVTPEGETRIATIMTVTLSCDHRAVDGVTGARFLGALRRRLEDPGHIGTE